MNELYQIYLTVKKEGVAQVSKEWPARAKEEGGGKTYSVKMTDCQSWYPS